MTTKTFYRIHESHHTTAIQINQVITDYNPMKGYAAKPGYIERCWKVFRGEAEPFKSPFNVVYGPRLDNFVSGTIIYQYFLSCAFADILAEAGITGFRVRHEDVTGPHGEPICYRRLIVTGRCGAVKHLNPDKVFDRRIYSCSSFPLEGVDFFLPATYGSFYCTERVVKLIKKHKLKVSSYPVDFVSP